MKSITFLLNDVSRTVEVLEGMRAVDVLRDIFGLTGTKEACGQGECGACTILFNDAPVHACLLLAYQMDGASIVTIEGLEKNGELDIIQQCFLEAGAIQCGFCTPGMIMAAKGLLIKNKTPDEEEIKTAMSGNLCRCTGYKKIQEAVMMASQRIRQRSENNAADSVD